MILAYDLKQDWTGALRHPREFRVVLQPTHFIFNGHNAFIFPESDALAIVRARFAWKNLPSDWTVASSFGNGKRHQEYTGPWHEILYGLFAAGDFRVRHIQASGERLTLAIRSSWSFTDAQAAKELRSLFEIERAFWGERQRSAFLIVITNFEQDLGSTGGTVFTKAFQFYLSRKQTFGVDEKSSLAHEIFHTWNPQKIGLPPNNGEEVEWFTEGFTSYYQDRILLRAKLISFPQYIERLNAIIASYWTSPDRNWKQSQWLTRSVRNRAESKLPYDRGAVIALWLDDVIRQHSSGQKSLDDVMFSVVHDRSEPRISTKVLLSKLSVDLDASEARLLRSFVEDGATIGLPPSLFGGNANLHLPDQASIPRYRVKDYSGSLEFRP